MNNYFFVIPACCWLGSSKKIWMPAFAGMTKKGFLILMVLFLVISSSVINAQEDAPAEEEQAREVLSKQEEDADSEKALEEVFQAAEKSYSLLKQGDLTLTYGFGYSYYGNQAVDIVIQPAAGGGSLIRQFDVSRESNHIFNNAVSVDYGIWNNLTLDARVPFIAKLDTENDLDVTALGDVSLGLRWQPFALARGLPTATFFASLGLPTGESPFEVNVDNELSTGGGAYSLSLGSNISQLLDPVVLFGSASYNYTFPVDGLNQARGGRTLEKYTAGDSYSLAMGMAYSLSYDVSLTSSYSQSFSEESTLEFSDDTEQETTFSTVAAMNVGLGIRTSPDYIVNISSGFGLTDGAPDVTLGLSLPIEIGGLKEEATY